jgi:hypothetical protein
MDKDIFLFLILSFQLSFLIEVDCLRNHLPKRLTRKREGPSHTRKFQLKETDSILLRQLHSKVNYTRRAIHITHIAYSRDSIELEDCAVWIYHKSRWNAHSSTRRGCCCCRPLECFHHRFLNIIFLPF